MYSTEFSYHFLQFPSIYSSMKIDSVTESASMPPPDPIRNTFNFFLGFFVKSPQISARFVILKTASATMDTSLRAVFKERQNGVKTSNTKIRDFCARPYNGAKKYPVYLYTI